MVRPATPVPPAGRLTPLRSAPVRLLPHAANYRYSTWAPVAQRDDRRPGEARIGEDTLRIGLDLDGLLDERPDCFAFLAAALRGQGHFVAVLTYRDPASRPKAETQLAGWGIQYDELHFARSLRDKGRLCRELAIDVYFDDQDECVQDVGE